MEIQKGYHLTYCTNIHPGETWEEVFESLKKHLPSVKKKVSPDQPFGIGLRLSSQASQGLLERDRMQRFREFLYEEDLYVFTMNGFPYGGFHHQEVKDLVHKPDWTTPERLAYTNRLFDILSHLLPEGMEGGISTSPLSYKYWLETDEKMEATFLAATRHIAETAYYLYQIEEAKGQWLHLDIEPEPDGLLENSEEVIRFFDDYLLRAGLNHLMDKYHISSEEAEALLRRHIMVCYDVCHFAIGFEEPKEVFKRFENAGIGIGKVQISAALKTVFPETKEGQQAMLDELGAFSESTYLHQVVSRKANGEMRQYNDLPTALEQPSQEPGEEWRTHFHVPIFLEEYGALASTQDAIRHTLDLLKEVGSVRHLEIETYTWEVLPKEVQIPLGDSIIRELQWVLAYLDER